MEYSNEVWNFFFSQASANYNAAIAEVKAGNPSLNFDGQAGTYQQGWRRVPERGLQISNMFRSISGNSAMPGTSNNPRIRPVLETQQGDAQGTFSEPAHMLMGFYNNLEGNYVGPSGSVPTLKQWPASSLVVTGPHPPSYYFYGGGGSAYYSPDNSNASLNITTPGENYFWTSLQMNVANWYQYLKLDADVIKTMGLKRIAFGKPAHEYDYCSASTSLGAIRRRYLNVLCRNWRRSVGFCRRHYRVFDA